MSAGLSAFCEAIARVAERDFDAAVPLFRRASAASPESRLFAEARRHAEKTLNSDRTGEATDLYDAASAFRAFVRGGGNSRLYSALQQALSTAYDEQPRPRLIDIGAGDGLALLPALTPRVAFVTAVEPAAEMRQALSEGLTARGLPHEVFGCTAQALLPRFPDATWDIAQATFSLQHLVEPDRAQVLTWLRRAAPRLLVAEFDVPRFENDADRIRYVADRYEKGLAEYPPESSTGDLVVRGFLMPILFGSFDRDRPANVEQPLSAWLRDLESAGYTQIRTRLLHDYWWASAHLIDAR